MTHLEKFIALYKEIGVDLKPKIMDDEQILWLEAGAHILIKGYSGFVTTIAFDMNGDFLYQDIAE